MYKYPGLSLSESASLSVEVRGLLLEKGGIENDLHARAILADITNPACRTTSL